MAVSFLLCARHNTGAITVAPGSKVLWVLPPSTTNAPSGQLDNNGVALSDVEEADRESVIETANTGGTTSVMISSVETVATATRRFAPGVINIKKPITK